MNRSLEEHNRRTAKHGDKYHNDYKNIDLPGEYFRVIGRFNGDWFVDVHEVKQFANEQQWGDSDYIDIHKFDGTRNTKLVDSQDRELPRIFQSMIDVFDFDGVITCSFQNQKPGNTVTKHHDDFTLEVPDNEKAVRIMIFLEDWEPGQTVTYGNFTLDKWTKGTVVFADYEKIPHSTANSSHNERAILLITAIASQKTTELIAYGIGIVDLNE